MIVRLGARVSDGCAAVEVVNEDGAEMVRLDVEVDFEVDVEVLRLDDDSELLLRLDDIDVLDVVEVVDVVVVVDVVNVAKPLRDEGEFVDVVRFELEDLLFELTVLTSVRVGLAFADKCARGAD